ncbi:hypothetical protein A3Q56_03588 [Intoshia linei]|uniref:Uncharacterized protein n=1 Tax=Intoshia linei TaxID=1819745 RepID=A0A177B368_9BILA|nr:hypothetical protein A3Q56_03588 [Intoshia linei]
MEVNDLNVKGFVESRIKELKEMVTYVETRTGMQGVLQRLPKFSRRRAASHNSKRIPRYLRNRCMNDTNIPKSRYHRRRHCNLKNIHNNFDSKVKWIESHIWHAKRFKMEILWDYKIPVKCNDKTFRKNKRSLDNYAAISDISYYELIEVACSTSSIIFNFDLFFHNFEFIPQKMQTYVIFNHLTKNPIGPVQIMCRYSKNVKDNVVWIWCHPSITKIVFSTISNRLNSPETSKNLLKKNMMEKFSQAVFSSNNFLFETSHMDCVRLINNRPSILRILGPMSSNLLYSMLQNINTGKSENFANSDWTTWNMFNQSGGNVFKDKHILSLSTLCPIPQYSNVNKFWRKNTKSYAHTCDIQMYQGKADQIEQSDLWNYDKRDTLFKTFSKDNKIKIPILLCRIAPDSNFDKSNDFTSIDSKTHQGWDLIIPKGYLMQFLLTLVYKGVSVLSINDLYTHNAEVGLISFPLDYIDCESYKDYSNEKINLKQNEYNAKPASKRVNYLKNGFNHAFTEPCLMWNSLSSLFEKLNVNEFKWLNLPFKEIEHSSVLILRDFKVKLEIEFLLSFKKNFKTEYTNIVKKYINNNSFIPVKIVQTKGKVMETGAFVCVHDFYPTECEFYTMDDIEKDLFKNGVIGFVTNPTYSLKHSRSIAIAFVNIRALIICLIRKLYISETVKFEKLSFFVKSKNWSNSVEANLTVI